MVAGRRTVGRSRRIASSSGPDRRLRAPLARGGARTRYLIPGPGKRGDPGVTGVRGVVRRRPSGGRRRRVARGLGLVDPLLAAAPAAALLAGHRGVTCAAQPRKMSVAHRSALAGRRVAELDLGGDVHLVTFPSRRHPLLCLGDGPSNRLGNETVREVAVRRWPAVLCAKSFCRSGEVVRVCDSTRACRPGNEPRAR